MEAQPALKRAERAVELDPHSAVDMNLPDVVLPRHPEDNLPLRFAQPFQQPALRVLRVKLEGRCQRRQRLVDGLQELRLGRTPVPDGGLNLVKQPRDSL